MKIFITGATGFIGQHLCRLLINQGHQITALLRTPKKRRLLPTEVEIIKGDLSLFEQTDLILPAFDIVIHLAGVIFAPDDATYMHYNCTAVKNLVACLERQSWRPKRFLFASSLAAAGSSGEHTILTEKDPPNPVDPYGLAKLKAEEFLATVNTFPTTSFRPAIVLGTGDENSLTLFKMAKAHMGISVNGQSQYISFVDIEDLNQGIIKMMEDQSAEHKVYFVAHPDKISNKGIFRNLAKIMDKKVWIIPLPKPILYIAMHLSTFFSKLLGIQNQLDKKQYHQLLNHFVCSGAALSQDLDWQPKYNLHDTLQKAYEGYKGLGWL